MIAVPTLAPMSLLLLLGLVAACTPAPAPVEVAPDAATAAAGPLQPVCPQQRLASGHGPDRQEGPVAAGEPLLWADRLEECGSEQVATIHWSRAAVARGPATIELGERAGEGVFARIGDAGNKPTGPWAYPGLLIVLRGDSGEIRARLVLEGPDGCGGE